MTGDSNSSWEAYSKMVLKQLENLDQSMNGLRQEIQELKAELAEMRGKQSNVQDVLQSAVLNCRVKFCICTGVVCL